MLAATHDSMPGDKESMSKTDQKKGDLLLQKSEAVKELVSKYKSDKLSENGTFYGSIFKLSRLG
jgi:hypothetical protein